MKFTSLIFVFEISIVRSLPSLGMGSNLTGEWPEGQWNLVKLWADNFTIARVRNAAKKVIMEYSQPRPGKKSRNKYRRWVRRLRRRT